MPWKRLCFKVFCEHTKPGDEVVVCGKFKQLGSWEPLKGLVLNGCGYPYWRGYVDLFMLDGEALEYKFVIRKQHGDPQWEQVQNRTLALHDMDRSKEWNVEGAFDVSPKEPWVDALASCMLARDLRVRCGGESPGAHGCDGKQHHSEGERLLRLAQVYTERLLAARPDQEAVALPVPEWRGQEGDARVVLAAVSVAVARVHPTGYPRDLPPLELRCRPADRSFAEMLERAQARIDLEPTHLVPLPMRQSSRDWVREATDMSSRMQRLAAAFHTVRVYSSAAAGAGCTHRAGPETERRVQRLQALLDGTCPVRDMPPMGGRRPVVWRDSQHLVEAACEAARGGCRVALVNAASAYHPGGGFLTGGRHASEEALCMQSTLYCSLARAEEAVRTCQWQGLADGQHIPEDGCVLSPSVEFFRHGTDSGYAPMEDVVEVAGVISVAMPNRNPNVTDSPLDRRSWHAYHELLRQKFRSVIWAANECSATMLLLPDCGCGVFHNDPEAVGKALGHVLSEGCGTVEQVRIYGSAAFAEAVRLSSNSD